MNKCETVQFSSNGFQLTSNFVDKWSANNVDANLFATLFSDSDPATQHGVRIDITFKCGILSNKCCIDSYYTTNSIGNTHDIIPPHTEPMECLGGKDVSKQSCDTAQSGWCGVHITQYQKNEGPGFNTENYRFTVLLYDGAQTFIGERELLSIPSGTTEHIYTKPLQYTLALTAPNVDDDPINLAYAGDFWNIYDAGRCSTGVYDEGKREIDCGFTC